ncbi:regulator of chromosome condensation 1/beta-lactamase-inhibitor protein II [Mycena belliarum]|uniref:Regulator of chromosome condensation 1/beta-lactamase-inhibitor protein II n=1 Tax=Mycena belliarum TaxID=1033014 RepID=A0AAD6XJ84_9AGAR|nr:regulator of chromosome condensation 1/beta-lactamase-inhibitor protein II [Mycena belliae]
MLWSAGSNGHGQLANGSLIDSHIFSPCSFLGCLPGTLPQNRKLVHLAFGANHTLALLESTERDGQKVTELWGCGDGNAGQLGPSFIGESIATFRPLDLLLERNGLAGYLPRLVCASWQTTYAVMSCPAMPDVLISIGANDFGDLGIGAIRAKPVRDFHIVGLEHFCAGAVAVALLAAGQHHVVVRLAGGPIVGWGTARHGQLGAVETPFLPSPAVLTPARADVIHAALGHQHTVFLHAAGTVSGLGSNRKRQLHGIGNRTRARSVACTWNGTYITTDDGDLLSTGSNANGQLGHADSDDAVAFPFTAATHQLLHVACGSEHVLASFAAGPTTEVWGWGWNEHGNLGVGTTEDVRLPCKIWPPDSSQAQSGRVSIWAGLGTSWIAVQSH